MIHDSSDNMKLYVVYWNNIPAPYMVERFNAVAQRGNLNFEAWFNERLESDRSWEIAESNWQFRYRYMPSIGIGGHRFRFPVPLLRRNAPDVLVSLYAEPVFVTGWAIAQQRGVRTAFWCQVTMDRWVRRRAWKDAIKRIIFPRVDATFGSGEESRAFAMRYGTPSERASILRHSIDVAHFTNGRTDALQERERIRQELGLRGVTFIYVGRLWWGKGLDHLLDALGEFQSRREVEASLLIVGDGLEEARLRERCRRERLRNIVFAGFRQKPELPHYYAASDVFVFPTLGDPYGLVVDEAMACSLPVISTSAAGEIQDRIEEGVNGYIVPPGNSTALCERMERLARNAELRLNMGKASAQKISGHTPEQWAKDFERAVAQILSRPKQTVSRL